jgi:ribosomal protein S18 acetylase RimI-like enzyme
MAEYRVRRMRPREMELAVSWAAAEGWNPGPDDATLFYHTDPNGFFIGELDGEPIASLSAVAYGADFGFIGFYIVKPEYRGHGYGLRLWREATAYLAGRNVGLDGVIAQQENYRRSGFTLAYRNVRYQGVGIGGSRRTGIVPLAQIELSAVCELDRQVFPADRSDFVRRWNQQPHGRGWAAVSASRLLGYGVIRQCQDGYKIGPLTATDETSALALFETLAAEAAGQPLFLDVPEVNPRAVELARRYAMTPVFETARMYSRETPAVAIERVYGITSFELG